MRMEQKRGEEEVEEDKRRDKGCEEMGWIVET
jgi:hypothetical protein